MALTISDVDRMIKDVKTAEDVRLFGKVYKAAKWASLTQDEKGKELIRLEHEDKERLILEQQMKEFDETAKQAAKAKKEAKALAIKQAAENKKKMKYFSPDGTITQNGEIIGKLEVDPEPKVVEVPKVVVARSFLDELNNSLEKSLNKITCLKSDIAELTNTIFEKDKQIEENAEYHNRIYVSLKDDKKKLNQMGKKVQDERNAAQAEVDVLKVQIKALEKQIKSLTKALELSQAKKEVAISPTQQATSGLVSISTELLKEQQERVNGWVLGDLETNLIKEIRIGKKKDDRQFIIRRGNKQTDGTILINDFLLKKNGVMKFFDIYITSWISGDLITESGGKVQYGWISISDTETIYPLTFNLINNETGEVFESTSLTLNWMDTKADIDALRFGYYFINGKGVFSIDITAGGSRLTNIGGSYKGRLSLSTEKKVFISLITHKAFDPYFNKGLYGENIPKLKPESPL